ncbi:alpha/beta hydrolase family protein [Myroides guanonis]|uniref:Dipeptidyl aminopeptidase/acylaminoacyl peptidase n=1 Tax=Myroides guanonis TaxID=1150112 RepID=A0A1I3QZX5_9FLAO|nr:prolyl oligopeptidase family serine peptidase [Myroides guanonis]SFJ39638.1 Dipeptidyl aminopeptidase/acylaminoacyl peptidase [Myroides guanonis]
MGIRKFGLLVILLLYYTISLASHQRDSISIDTRWNQWLISSISSKGDWVSVYLNYPNNRSQSKGFALHIETKKRIEITGISQHQFTAIDFLIGRRAAETVELDLKTQKEISLGKLKQQDWIEAMQTLYFINENNQLVLRKYEKKGAKEILKLEKIASYSMNPSKNQLLYQKEGETVLYHLDLKTLKEKRLLDLKESFSGATWSFSEDVISSILENKNIVLIDLSKGSFKTIELPKEERSISNVWSSFFSNNDLFISYQVLNAVEKDPIKDYLDIWNGNDRELKYKTSGAGWGESGVYPPKMEGETKAVVYQSSKEELIVLPQDAKKKYLNIGVPNYLLVYDPLELQDYSETFEKVRYRLFQIDTAKEIGDLITAINFESYYRKSPDNRYILYPKNDIWEIYDFETGKRMSFLNTDTFNFPIWSSDSRFIYYHNYENLLQYDVTTQKTRKITNLKGKNRFSIVNSIREGNSVYVDVNKPTLFYIDQPNNKTSYYSFFKGKLTNIVDTTSNRLNTSYLNRGVSDDGQTLVWTEENYNQPPTVKVFRKGKVTTLLEAAVPKELYNWRKQKVIHYKDKYGVDLTGVLWYPKDFNHSIKYPMVTYIYERQNAIGSYFEIPKVFDTKGFNRTVLNEQGYFVFQPDTYVSEEGAGLSALECVTKGIETITALEPAIDKTKLGLMGHSFGGYETSFILSQSKLFATGVSGAGAHDLISFNYEYNYMLKMPNWFRVEGPQQDLRDSFGDNSTKYYKNSPIHFAQNFETPVLLWTGMKDDNSNWEQTRHMYIALKRYQKPVIALFYKREGHSFNNKKEQLDLTYRVLDWFDYYLKGETNKEWIAKGIDYNNY